MTISRPIIRIPAAILVATIAFGVTVETWAWGPRSRQMIAAGALQLERYQVPDCFRGETTNYEIDLFAGARDGIPALGGTFPMNTDLQSMDAVQSQIQILREARMNGAGSYFAYRMGGLCALTAEVLQPYGIVYSEADQEISNKIDAYLESRASEFSFTVHHPNFQYILNTALYLKKHRGFYDSDLTMIEDDFKRGRGARGMLAEAGQHYYERAVHATVDVWYTVLRPEGEPSDVPPSREQMALYYIEEVKYLLKSKGNLPYAKTAYEMFKKYHTGMPMAYIELGDAFYNYGTPEGIERGVQEWVRAYDIPGAPRKAASVRLSKHYLEKGEGLFERAQGPLAQETDLNDALKAFNDALRYDRSSDVAANRIEETTVAIARRKEEYESQELFINQALTAMQQAQRAALDADYASAITSYNQAEMLVGLVTDQFKDLNAKARDTGGEINKSLKTVISDVFKSANEAIERGNDALAANNVDEAVRYFSSVSGIVDVVPSQEGTPNAETKNRLIATAQEKIDEAEIQRRRLEQQQQPAAPPGGSPI
jgi:hypothetical protein